jgi:hypothetical protein
MGVTLVFMLRTSKYCMAYILLLVLVINLFITACVAENAAAPIEAPETTPLAQELPVSAITAVVTANDTLTPTIMPTTTPSPSPVPTTPTSTLTPIPSPTIEPLNWNLKIAFASLQESNGTFVSRLWVIDFPEQEPRQLIEFRPAATSSANRVSWSHDGQYVAFGHHIAENVVAVSIVDVTDSTVQQLGFSFPLDPFNTGNSSSINLSYDSWSLDDQWVQATLSYFKPDSNFPIEQELLLSIVDDRVIELDEQIEFVAWSKSVPDQFLYILHPDSEMGYPTVHIGQVSLAEPVASILDLEEYSPGIRFNISWAANGLIAFSSSYDVATGSTHLTLLDLETGTWQLLPYKPRGRAAPFLWSPDNRWIVFWHSGSFYLWPIYETDRPTMLLPSETDQITSILGWLPIENWLVYQMGDKLFAIDPEAPDNPHEIFDFESLRLTSEQRIQSSVWILGQS